MTDTVQRRGEKKERLEDILVVDCDVHVSETPGKLAPYCDMPWRVSLETMDKNAPARTGAIHA